MFFLYLASARVSEKCQNHDKTIRESSQHKRALTEYLAPLLSFCRPWNCVVAVRGGCLGFCWVRAVYGYVRLGREIRETDGGVRGRLERGRMRSEAGDSCIALRYGLVQVLRWKMCEERMCLIPPFAVIVSRSHPVRSLVSFPACLPAHLPTIWNICSASRSLILLRPLH
jgi:hypothetical protein